MDTYHAGVQVSSKKKKKKQMIAIAQMKIKVAGMESECKNDEHTQRWKKTVPGVHLAPSGGLSGLSLPCFSHLMHS